MPQQEIDMGYKPWGGTAGIEAGERNARRAIEDQLRNQNIQLQNELLRRQLIQQQTQERERERVTTTQRSESAASDFQLAKTLWNSQSGNSHDRPRAVELIKKSAEAGYPPSLLVLGRFYLAGQYVPKDVDRGTQLIQKSAAAGNREAEAELGKLTSKQTTTAGACKSHGQCKSGYLCVAGNCAPVE